MKTLVILCTMMVLSAHASLKSPFKSSIPGIELPNSHYVGEGMQLIRGMAPMNYLNDLLKLDVTDVLIFKNQTKDEIDKEKILLKEIGIERIYEIPFLWHDYSSYQETCEQTLKALKLMRSMEKFPKRKLFFHCTVGEDRTGYLAGIWDVLTKQRSVKDAFQKQMCERGYSRGNPKKPAYVVNEIREDLTPLFLGMVKLIKDGKLRYNYIRKDICKSLKVDLGHSVPKCKIQPID